MIFLPQALDLSFWALLNTVQQLLSVGLHLPFRLPIASLLVGRSKTPKLCKTPKTRLRIHAPYL
jgi:hypothetical protein